MSTDGTSRRVLLVGSLPYQDEASAMARACELAGDRLIALPDGEIGERSDRYPAGDRSQWTAGLTGRLAAEDSLFAVVQAGTTNERGFPADWDSVTRLRPRVGPAELGRSLRLGYDTFPRRTWPHFERLRASLGRPDLRMQVGLPTGFGVAAGFLSPPRALRYAPVFAACVAREATAVVQSIGAGNLLFQIEAPAEVVAAHRLPRPAVGVPTGPVIDLVKRLPAEVPVGLHLCFADLSNTAAITPSRFGRLVAFTNALARRWPPTHDLAYVHLPFAAGTEPAPTDPTAYRALRRLALPPGTRLVAGFVHEQPPLETLEALLATIEQARRAQVDTATACGLGRRTPETADELIRRCHDLARSLAGGDAVGV